jgi:hypothetical protein
MSEKVFIIDDLYSEIEIEENEKFLLENVIWQYGQSSNGNDITCFWTGHIDHNTLIKEMFNNFLLEIFIRYSIKMVDNYNRVYLNGQTYELNGDWHPDCSEAGYHTLLYMVNAEDTDNIGDFQYIDPSNKSDIKTVPFKPGRFVLFPSHWKHRGLAPSVKNKLRITLAYKEIKFL